MSKTYVRKIPAAGSGIWAGKRPLLSSLDIELTERCNNACSHCYINRPQEDEAARRTELSAAEIREVLEEAASLGCLSVRFTGGEPLVRDDFEEIYLAARKLGLKVAIATNATRITPRLADLLARVPPLLPVEITLYGSTREIYEALSGRRGSFDAAIRGVTALRERRLPFVITGTALSSDDREIEAFDRWVRANFLQERDPARVLALNLRAHRDDDGKNERIKALRLSPDRQYRILSRDEAAFRRDMARLFSRFAGPQGDRLFACEAGTGSACLDSCGRLQACVLLRHPDATYDLKKGSLEDALKVFFPSLRETRAKNPDYIARCAGCFLSDLCDQCPARSWMESGTLDAPIEYFCRTSHRIARGLGLLGDTENAWDVPDRGKRIEEFVKRGGRNGPQG